MQFVDITRQYAHQKHAIDKRVARVFAHARFILGPEVMELEEALARDVGCSHCVSCGSGTDALVMALMALDIGPGDAVITTPFTFVATAEAIALVGARPVFTDIEPDTFCMDAGALERTIAGYTGTDTLRAVIPVDLFGQIPDYDRIDRICAPYGITVLADAAQSFGAVLEGRRAGSLGHMAATSFFPAKPLGCFGDGGAVFCHDEERARLLRSLRVHGMGTNKYENVRIGINGRLDTLQAAVLLAKLSCLDEELARRRAIAERYNEALAPFFTTPRVREDCESAWAQYSLLHPARDAICEQARQHGVPTAIYYPIPLHMQKAFAGYGYTAGDFPVSERTAGHIFSIPIDPYLTDEEIDTVITTLIAAAQRHEA